MAKEIQKIQSYGRLLRQVKQRVALAQQRCMMEFYQEYNQELTMVKSNAKPPVSHLTAGKAILQPTVAELREHAITQPTVAKLSEYNFTLPIRNEYQKIKVLLEWMGINYNDFLYGLDHVVQVCDKIDRLEPI